MTQSETSDSMPVTVYAVDELRALRDWHLDQAQRATAAEREHRERAQALDAALIQAETVRT